MTKPNRTVNFLHTSDWHLGRKNHNSKIRYLDNFRAVGRMIKQIEKANEDEKIDFIVHCGDLFHSADFDPQTLCLTIDLLKKFKNMSIPFFIIRGNHDTKEGDYKNTYLHALDRTQLVTLVDDEVIKLHDGDVNIYGLGHRYTGYKEYFDNLLNKNRVNQSNYNILLLHTTVSGLDNADKRSGLKKTTTFSASELMDEGFDYIGLGHHHKTEVSMKNNKKQVIAYSGAPEHWSYVNWEEDSWNKTKNILQVRLQTNRISIEELHFKVRPKRLLMQDQELNLSELKSDDAKEYLLKVHRKLNEEAGESFTKEHFKPMIYTQFIHNFSEEEHGYPFDDLKDNMGNILPDGSRIQIRSTFTDEEIIFNHEEELIRNLIEEEYENSEDLIKFVYKSIEVSEALQTRDVMEGQYALMLKEEFHENN